MQAASVWNAIGSGREFDGTCLASAARTTEGTLTVSFAPSISHHCQLPRQANCVVDELRVLEVERAFRDMVSLPDK
jgi:hypothetical protein